MFVCHKTFSRSWTHVLSFSVQFRDKNFSITKIKKNKPGSNKSFPTNFQIFILLFNIPQADLQNVCVSSGGLPHPTFLVAHNARFCIELPYIGSTAAGKREREGERERES